MGMVDDGSRRIDAFMTGFYDQVRPNLIFPKFDIGLRDFLPYRTTEARIVVAEKMQKLSPSGVSGRPFCWIRELGYGQGLFQKALEVVL